jgi:hypothetical protein
MYKYPKFDVEITRDVTSHRARWPEARATKDDSGLGGNLQYVDLRRMPWSEVVRVNELEDELIARMESATDSENEYEQIEEELYEEIDGLYGLDLGVASSVVALSAVRCIPFASCNAGAFGGDHHECYPLVAFYAHAESIDLLLECAVISGIGLVIEETGELVAYAADIRQMKAFANTLISRRTDFLAIRTSRANQTGEKPGVTSQQEVLALDDDDVPEGSSVLPN